ncbi:hypothetical protein AAC387_Pa12g1750 [Persea americana]
MDLDVRSSDRLNNSSVDDVESKPKGNGVDREEYEESNALLSPRRGGMSKKPRKVRRKVKWNDRNGNKLFEILEFQPSDTSDSDDDDGTDSCFCVIM